MRRGSPATGDAAWIWFAEQPRIVVTDLFMPEKEGIETILELRRACPDTKIIAMSGSGADGRREPLENGAAARRA